MALSQVIPAVLITLMYFVSGLSKIKNFTPVSAGLAERILVGLPLAKFIIILVILLELLAPLVIVASDLNPTTENRKYKVIAAWALAGFTVLATILYHLPPVGSNYYQFMSNITALGALVLLGEVPSP